MISTVSDACVRTVLVASMSPRLSTHYTTAFRLSFSLTVLRCKSVSSDRIRNMHEDCMLGLVRPPFGHTSVLSSWSMPPPVDRIRDLPSSSDLSFPQPVHESVSGTLLTTTGQDLSPPHSRQPPPFFTMCEATL